MTAQVTPVVSFSNDSRSILDYLKARTADTIGSQVDRAQVVIVGTVRESDARHIPIRSEQIPALEAWLSGDAAEGASIIMQFTKVGVERWLAGQGQTDEIEVAYPAPKLGAGKGPLFTPVFYVQERGLMFLREIPGDVAFAPYIRRPSYQLAPGEKGVRSFLPTDYDQKGQPFTRDETEEVEETISAVQWYTALPREDVKKLRPALLVAVNDSNPQIVRHAIRALANLGDSDTAQEFEGRLQTAAEDLQVRFMLGLWILGEQETAESILEALHRIHGRYPWLSSWGIQPSLVEEGQPVDTLFAPDPSEVKGD